MKMNIDTQLHPSLQFTQKTLGQGVHLSRVSLRKISWDKLKDDGTRNQGECWILSNSQSYSCTYKLPNGTEVKFGGSFGRTVTNDDEPVTLFLSDSATKQALSDDVIELLKEQWCGNGTFCFLLTNSLTNSMQPLSSKQALELVQPQDSGSDDSVQDAF